MWFFHEQVYCPEYLKDGKCLDWNFFKRHGQVCRYWKKNKAGCFRGEKCQHFHKIIKSTKNIRNTKHPKNEFCSKESEGESEDENETEVKYTSEDSESNYKIETEVSDEAEMRDKLNNKIRDFLNKFQSEND